jgi:multiple sugar transport system ATP-binding protein
VVQQVGTPTEIYDRPSNTFVAGFIGSPAMNLVTGSIENGVFTAPGVRIAGLLAANGPVTLGFRAEDAAVVPAGGEVEAPVYTLELLGDSSMISMRIGDELVSIKAPKEFRAEIGQKTAAAVPARCCHLFDRATGARLAA